MGGRYDDALGSTAGDPVNGQQEGSSYKGHFGSTFYHPLFVSHTVCLALLVLAYNLGNFQLRLCLSKAVRHWLPRSVRVKLIKIGGQSRASRKAVDFSVVRGVGSWKVIPVRVESHRPVIAGPS